MNNESEVCSQEPIVLAARAVGRIDDELAQHLSICASCREADALAARMQKLVTMPVGKPAPDADIVWISAQLSKSSRTRWTPETWKGIAALASVALLASLVWPAAQGYLSGLLPMRLMPLAPMLLSGIVAGGLAAIALRMNGLLTDD